MSFLVRDAQLTYYNQDLQLENKLTGVYQTVLGGSSFGSVGAAGQTTVAFTVKGLRPISGTGAAGTAAGAANQLNPGDTVVCTPSANLTAGLAVYCAVTAANTLSISLVNGSAAPIAAGSPNFVVTIFRFGQLDGVSA